NIDRGPLRPDVRRKTRAKGADTFRRKRVADLLGNHVHVNVVDHRAISGPGLAGLQPLADGPAWIDFEVLVFDHSLGRHSKRLLAHVDYLVRLAHPPAGYEFARLGQVLVVAARSAVGHPIANLLFLLIAQPRVVHELAEARIGGPGGHSAVVDDFADRG